MIEKPAGLSLFSDRSGDGNLWEILHGDFPGVRQVHRIDKGTSGLLLVALSERAQQSLTRQFTEGNVTKHYLAICEGRPEPREGFIDLPLARGRKSKHRVAFLREEIICSQNPDGSGIWRGKPGARLVKTPNFPSETAFRSEPIGESDYSLLAIRLLTGRTHQIRVHFRWIGHPLADDEMYGGKGLSRMYLHSAEIAFENNWKGKSHPMKFQSLGPEGGAADFHEFWEKNSGGTSGMGPAWPGESLRFP